MSGLNHIEILKLHSEFLDRNKELVEAIRDRRPCEVVNQIFRELQQICYALRDIQLRYSS